MIILSIDPSGNFESGKGRTGIAMAQIEKLQDPPMIINVNTIAAKNYGTRFDYWSAVRQEILLLNEIKSKKHTLHVTLENFVVRSNGFTTGTMPETIRLIGVLEYTLEKENISYSFQTPSAVKTRFNNDVLLRVVPGLTKTGNYYRLHGDIINDHERDAIRHLLYFNKYGTLKGDK